MSLQRETEYSYVRRMLKNVFRVLGSPPPKKYFSCAHKCCSAVNFIAHPVAHSHDIGVDHVRVFWMTAPKESRKRNWYCIKDLLCTCFLKIVPGVIPEPTLLQQNCPCCTYQVQYRGNMLTELMQDSLGGNVIDNLSHAFHVKCVNNLRHCWKPYSYVQCLRLEPWCLLTLVRQHQISARYLFSSWPQFSKLESWECIIFG